MLSGYPETFIESAVGVPTDMQSTFYLDGLSIMTIVEDPTGYLSDAKEFVASHRFAPEVLPRRLERMLMSAEGKLDEAGQAQAAARLDLWPRYDLARCIAQMWLEAHGTVYSRKEQDALLADAAREAKVPEVHAYYRALLGLDVPDESLRDILGPVESFAAEIDALLAVVEGIAAQREHDFGADVVEYCKALRLSTALSLQSVRVAFEKGCYAHMAFTLQKLGPAALGDLLGLLRRLAPPEQMAMFEEACASGLERSRIVWEFFGQMGPGADDRRRLEVGAKLVDLTRRHLVTNR